MNLWIRTQDRAGILKCEKLYIQVLNGEFYISNENEFPLGTYKTRGKALEVLDEIQKKIDNIHKDYLMACMKEKGTYEVIAWIDFTYEMPKK